MRSEAKFCFKCVQLGHHALLRRSPPDVGRPVAPALPAVVREAQERKGLRLFSPRFFPSWAANLPNSISRVFSAHSGDAAELALMALTRESRDATCESRPEILHCVTQRPFCLIITGLAARACAEPPRFSFPVQSQYCAASFAVHRGVVVSRSERYRLRHLRNAPRIIADAQVAGQPDVGRAARGATPTDPIS